MLFKDTQWTYLGRSCHQHSIFPGFTQAVSGNPHKATAMFKKTFLSPGAGSEINGTVSSATSSHSHRSVCPPATFVCFLTQGCSFLRQGLMRGEFLAVTFSWEMIGPAPKFGCRSKSGGNRTGPHNSVTSVKG